MTNVEARIAASTQLLQILGEYGIDSLIYLAADRRMEHFDFYFRAYFESPWQRVVLDWCHDEEEFGEDFYTKLAEQLARSAWIPIAEAL